MEFIAMNTQWKRSIGDNLFFVDNAFSQNVSTFKKIGASSDNIKDFISIDTNLLEDNE